MIDAASKIKIHGLTVCGNEVDRYLESSLLHNYRYLDTIFIYDDQSDDGSMALSLDVGTEVVRRPDDVPTFLEHEGAFRQAAWDAWVASIQPAYGDWVLAFDVDEFYYGPPLHSLVGEYVGGVIRRPEMWSYTQPLHRVDGEWSKITNIRFFPYAEPGVFHNKELAGGSAPSYTESTTQKLEAHLLHYGYADPGDRKVKYSRYIDRPGHSRSHIRSIKRPAKIEDYTPNEEWGPMPQVWRGMSPC